MAPFPPSRTVLLFPMGKEQRNVLQIHTDACAHPYQTPYGGARKILLYLPFLCTFPLLFYGYSKVMNRIIESGNVKSAIRRYYFEISEFRCLVWTLLYFNKALKFRGEEDAPRVSIAFCCSRPPIYASRKKH